MNTENESLAGTVSEDAASTNTEAPNNEAQTQTSEAAPSETAPVAETNPTETAPEAETAPAESAPAVETAPVDSATSAETKAETESVPTPDKPAANPESTATFSPTIADAPAAAKASPLGDVPYDFVYIINNPLVSAQTELVQLPNGKTVEISNTMTTGDALIAAGIFLLIAFQVLKFLLQSATRRR